MLNIVEQCILIVLLYFQFGRIKIEKAEKRSNIHSEENGASDTHHSGICNSYICALVSHVKLKLMFKIIIRL